jgi:hypothetical protein
MSISGAMCHVYTHGSVIVFVAKDNEQPLSKTTTEGQEMLSDNLGLPVPYPSQFVVGKAI